MNRRSLLTGMGATIIAAPAIVRASSLMPIKVWRDGGGLVWVPIPLRIRMDVIIFEEYKRQVTEAIFDSYMLPMNSKINWLRPSPYIDPRKIVVS